MATIKDKEVGARFRDLILCILKFADDIALTADSRTHLQKLVDALETYCYDNRLDISQTKSAVMYFEYGKPDQTSPLITIRAKPINPVSSFKYLGYILTKSLDSMKMKATALEKAERRLSQELAYARKHNLPVRSLVAIWKQLLMPVLDYCIGIWGDRDWKAADDLTSRAGRLILGLHEKTTVTIAAVFGELGLLTMRDKITQSRLRYYFKRILPSSNSSTLYRVFKHEQACFEAKQHKTADINWYSRLVEVLQEMKQTELLNLANILDQESRAEDARKFKHKEAARALAEVRWRKNLDGKNKMEAYKVFKLKLKCEPFLLNGPTHQVLPLCHLRISQHNLFIETGRRSVPQVERKLRICLLCDRIEAEDETHVILHCSAYHEIRTTTFDILARVTSNECNPWVMSDNECRLFILSAGYHPKKRKNHEDVNRIISIFISKIMKHRTQLFCDKGLDPKIFHSR